MAGSSYMWLHQLQHPQGHQLSKFKRVQQWLTFARQWQVLDAKFQDPEHLAAKIAMYLKGAHKPIYNPLSDCGDHVVVFNTRHLAMKAFDWKRKEYYFHNRRVKGEVWFPAHVIHEHQPTRILFLSVYAALDKNNLRRHLVERLHLFPDAQVPEAVMVNVSAQMRQVGPVPRKYSEYSDAERAEFPSIVNLPDDLNEEELKAIKHGA